MVRLIFYGRAALRAPANTLPLLASGRRSNHHLLQPIMQVIGVGNARDFAVIHFKEGPRRQPIRLAAGGWQALPRVAGAALLFVAFDIRSTPESPVLKWGFVLVTGYIGVLMPKSQADVVAGMWALSGILAALVAREQQLRLRGPSTIRTNQS